MKRFSPAKYVYCILICLPGTGPAKKFANLSASDLKMIVKDFSADSDFSTVSPASTLGEWGIELGLLVGETKTPDLQSLVTNAGGIDDLSKLPHAAAFAALTFPYGITGEASYFPEQTISGVSYSQIGFAVKWTLNTDLLPDLPFDLAIKAKYAKTKLATSQTIDNASTGNNPVVADVNLHDEVYGFEVFASKRFSIAEPYVGLGRLHGQGDLAVSGSSTATVFNPSYTQAQSATSSADSMQMIAGANVHLTIVALGAEYVRAFDVNTFNGKVSFQF